MLHPIRPWAFCIFGFLHVVWPGRVASRAKLLGYVVYGSGFEETTANWPHTRAVPTFPIRLIYVGGSWIYRVVEWAEIALVFTP